MKKIILLIAMTLVLVSGFSQSQWSYKEVKNPFDGNYEIARTDGAGNFPYISPALGIRVRDGDLQILFSNVNYGSIEMTLVVSVAFDGDEAATKYYAKTNKSGNVWFLDISYDEKIKLINMIKAKNILVVRLESPYSYENFVFSLKGATSAIKNLNL